MTNSLLSPLPQEDKDILWKQYQMHIDLYKHYLELTLKFNVFFYAVTGGILSFYFATKDPGALIRYSLLFPMIMSAGFGGIFFYAAYLIAPVRAELFKIRDALGLATAPDYQILAILLRLSAALLGVVVVALIILFIASK